MNQNLFPTETSRRTFLKTASLASLAAMTFPAILRSQGSTPIAPSRRVNVAIIGCGGIGWLSLAAMKDENIVAFCDVDDAQAQINFDKFQKMYPEEWKRHSGAPRFNDYRKMFDAVGNDIEAVTISIPDHMHFPAAVTALHHGKHVYCQKPLTHTVWEARELTKLAREKKVITQMGNQGHAGDGTRVLKEWMQAGILGEVKEVVSWTNRPGKFWPHVDGLPDHVKKPAPAMPPTLNWDAWLGVAAEREYDPAYLPKRWRGWWDFGTGPFGDVACHIMDGAYWALDLGAPTSVEATASGANQWGTPAASLVTLKFPARSRKLPAVTYTWMDGSLKPPLPKDLELGQQLNDEAGTLIFGSKATVLCSFYYDTVKIIPDAKMLELTPHLPPPSIPRVAGGPFAEWLRAIRHEGPVPGSNFNYSGPFTEAVLLSNVAIRAQRRIDWDSAALRVTNLPSANDFLTKQYRPGWM